MMAPGWYKVANDWRRRHHVSFNHISDLEMTILRVGPNSAYSEGWDAVFGRGKKLPKAAKPNNGGDPESPKPKAGPKAAAKKNLTAKTEVKTAKKYPVKTSSSKSGTKVKKAVSKKASSKRVTTKKPKA